eukprot:2203541-Alexandrium_andersonii.AAC.1
MCIRDRTPRVRERRRKGCETRRPRVPFRSRELRRTPQEAQQRGSAPLPSSRRHPQRGDTPKERQPGTNRG